MTSAVQFLRAPEVWRHHGSPRAGGLRDAFDPTSDELILVLGDQQALREWLSTYGLDESDFPIESSEAVGWHIDLSNDALRVARERDAVFAEPMGFREWMRTRGEGFE